MPVSSGKCFVTYKSLLFANNLNDVVVQLFTGKYVDSYWQLYFNAEIDDIDSPGFDSIAPVAYSRFTDFHEEETYEISNMLVISLENGVLTIS